MGCPLSYNYSTGDQEVRYSCCITPTTGFPGYFFNDMLIRLKGIFWVNKG
jgi:hypothetical protein